MESRGLASVVNQLRSILRAAGLHWAARASSLGEMIRYGSRAEKACVMSALAFAMDLRGLHYSCFGAGGEYLRVGKKTSAGFFAGKLVVQ